MFRVPTIRLAVVVVSLVSACAAQQPEAAAPAAVQPEEIPSQDLLSDDAAAREFLDLANQARAHVGVAPLQMDRDLSQAAGSHTTEMAAQEELSHQFSDETSLLQRLTAGSKLHLDRAGENVALAPTVKQAHDALMHSPAHRDNLLNARFNVAGISVVRSGRLLYVTEDFAHSSPVYSGEWAEEAVVRAVSQARSQAGVASLRRTSMSAAHKAACSMAQRKSLDVPQLPGRHVLRYTSFSPAELPASAVRTVTGTDIGELSVGTCYGQSSHEAGGMYYVVLVLK
jgi:uncharacterized protein YkwD